MKDNVREKAELLVLGAIIKGFHSASEISSYLTSVNKARLKGECLAGSNIISVLKGLKLKGFLSHDKRGRWYLVRRERR